MENKSVSVEHIPGYGQFYVQDPKKFDVMTSARLTKEDIEKGFAVGEGIVILFSQDQDENVQIELSVNEAEPKFSDKPWNEVAKSQIKIESNQIVLASCPDGPEYGAFGKLDLENRTYQIAVWKYKDKIEHFKIALW